MIKKILSLFLIFAIAFSMSTPAFAADIGFSDFVSGAVTFGEWATQQTILATQLIGSAFDDDICPSGSIDDTHDLQVRRTTLNGVVGNYYVCTKCGFNTGVTFEDAYSSYVSTLETPSVSSTDLTSGSVTTYTLADLSGNYLSSSVGPSPMVQEFTDFGVGEFPLSFSTYTSYSSGGTSSNSNSNLRFSNVSACAGDSLTVTYYFPACSASYVSSYTTKISFHLFGKNLDSSSTYPLLQVIRDSASLSVKNGYTFFATSYPSLFDPDTFSYQSITDSSGVVVGFSASGTLLYDLDYISSHASHSFSLSSSPSGYNYTNFKSYDDLTITVSSASGSGSSGSSSLPDESTRLGPVMQSINNYNTDNSYTDNSTVVNYYLTPNNGETLCSPVVFDESTKVFTVPETGQQFLCDYWI